MKSENLSKSGLQITQDSSDLPRTLLTSPAFLFFAVGLSLSHKYLLSQDPWDCLAMAYDMVHNTLLQTRGPWHVEYFQLKGYEKLHMQEGLSAPLLLPWSRSKDPHVGGAPPIPRGKERDRGMLRGTKGTGLAEFPLVYHASCIPFCPITVFYNFPLFIKPSIKMLRLDCLAQSSLSYEGSCVMKNFC